MLNTTLCYVERDGKYLMLHRIKKANDLNEGKWIGVGGKFEDRESPEDCMLRETFEETGLTPTTYKYRGIVTFISDKSETEYMHLFTVSEFTGQLKECDEGVLEWVNKADILSLPLWEGDRIFLKLLSTDAPFFSLKLEYNGDTLVNAVLNGKTLSPKKKTNILISACLLGQPCRYNASSASLSMADKLSERYNLIPVCPETLGGLSTPRSPAELVGNRVTNADGKDVTAEFELGAELALNIAIKNNCRAAILKERSPSCGFGKVYDGSFSGKLVRGYGVAARLLAEEGIEIYGESQVNMLL